MITPITKIQGADEALPKEIKINHEVNDCQTKREAFCLGVDCGINRCLSQLDSVGLELDVEEMAKIIWNFRKPSYRIEDWDKYANPIDKKYFRDLAQALAANQKIARLVRIQ